MKDLIDNLRTNFLEKLPPRISETLKESIEQSERNEFTRSLQTLSESVFQLLRDEYYIPSGLVWNKEIGVVEMIRELRKAGKDLGKSETDAILRIQEKAKLDDTDSVVLESCIQGAVEVLESYLREKGNRVQKKVEATERKSPGAYILEELEELLLESDTEEKIRAHFPKIEEIYRDFPYDKNVRKIYFQFLSLVDSERAKREILGYLEGGEVTIHLGAVCISLLAEMGFLYDAKKKLGWYEEEYAGEMDGKVAKLSVFLHAYLKEGREADRQRAESVLEIVGQNRDPYYSYMDNCFYIFSERENAIRQNSEGLYLYKESVFREKALQSKAERKDKELKQEQEKKGAKKSEVVKEAIIKVEESKTVEKIHIHENKPEASETKLEKTFTNSIGMEFILIPAGEFLMGAVPQDKEAPSVEKPQHKVRITKPFYLGKYPVTQEEWQKVMGNNPSRFKELTEGLIFKKVVQVNLKNPVETVSWNDCQEFIQKLSQKEGNTYRLPTGAEWEYAARGGLNSSHSSSYMFTYGDDKDKLGDYAWYDKNSGNTTHPVGQKKPNSIGLYDMMGNVWEWCEDWYDSGYYERGEAVDPGGPSSGSGRVLRGGSWGSFYGHCRTSYRGDLTPDYRDYRLGFRLARTP
jgi:formylglycine-generating enzyme required for sulfatase activity